MFKPIFKPLFKPLFTGASGGGSGLDVNNLVAYWKLDEESGTRFDATANGRNLTDINTTGFAAGRIGNAANFIPANVERLTKGTDTAFVFGGAVSYSISLWFNYTIVPPAGFYMSVAKVSVVTPTNRNYWMAHYPNRVSFRHENGTSGTNCEVFFTPSINTWYFVVGTYNHLTNTITTYIDDMTPATAVPGSGTGGSTQTSSDFNISYYTGSNAATFDGSVDEVGVWNVALTARQVAELYNGGAGKSYPFI